MRLGEEKDEDQSTRIGFSRGGREGLCWRWSRGMNSWSSRINIKGIIGVVVAHQSSIGSPSRLTVGRRFEPGMILLFALHLGLRLRFEKFGRI